MNNKKIYIVTADTYNEAYGSQISFFCAYDELEKAQQEAEFLEEKYDYFVQINEVTINETREIYLGGYIE